MNMIDKNQRCRGCKAGSSLSLSSTVIILFSALTLAGCGDGSGNPNNDYVSVQPVSVVLKPGEIERVRVTSETDDSPGFGGNFLFSGEISKNYLGNCIVPEPKCGEIDIEAISTATSSLLDIYEFSFTGDVLLGDQSLLPVSTFPALTQTLPPVIRFAAGGMSFAEGLLTHIGKIGFSLAVTADGSIWAWGINGRGQLGNGSREFSSIPRQVQHTGSFAAVAAGGEHAMAIDSDGSVWAWGGNTYGQLGTETAQKNNPLPVQVSNLSNIIAIAAGYHHSLALDDKGNVWSWGRNSDGQLGGDTRENNTTPQQLLNMTNIVAIAAGDAHSLALDGNGRVWAWGNNWYGQVAGRDSDGKPEIQSTPTVIENLGAATTIAAGEGYSLAVTRDGRVRSWGANKFGQLGRVSSPACNLTGGVSCSIGAAPVTGLDQVVDVAAGARFAIARRNDGSVWAWGDNGFGQVAGLPGLFSIDARPVEGLNGILRIEAGSAHALAMSSDDACSVGNGRTGGKLMAWGNNLFGARGDGTGANWVRPTPVLSIGDDNSCSGLTGHRVIIYKAGTGTGVIRSDIPGLNCTGIICWQSVAAGVDVTLTATPDAGTEFSDWSWDCSAQTQSMSMPVDSAKVCKIHFNRTSIVPPPPVPPTPEPTACNDGIDNDDNGLTDLDDPGCDSVEDNSENNITGTSFSLTINMTGEGEVFDNNDSDFFCYSEISASCVQTYPANSVASLRAVSFAIEDLALWSSECDNGIGAIDNCTINMNRDRTVSIRMQ